MNSLLEHVRKHLMLVVIPQYVLAPLLAPLGAAGFLFVICSMSLALRESVYPGGPPWGLSEPFATRALAGVCLVVPIPYFAFAFRLKRASRLLGYSARFWQVTIASAFLLPTAVAGAMVVAHIVGAA